MRNRHQFLQVRVTGEEKAAIKRAAERAGMEMSSWVLSRLFLRPPRVFQALVTALDTDPERRRYAFAELNDFLSSMGPLELRQAVADAPAATLEPYLRNYVAAMVETAAHRANIAAPSWTTEVAPLATPVFGSSLPALRMHLLARSPPAFRRRNIFIDAPLGDRV